MKIEDIPNIPEINIPPIALGHVVPYSIEEKIFEQECEEKRIKEQYKHDWKIAIVSALMGTIGGFFASLAFWLITN